STEFQNKDIFFAILQTERGDLFKLSLETQNAKTKALLLKYFDTVAPADQLCLSKDGFLFVASEFGDQELYEVTAVGELPNDQSIEIRSSSAEYAPPQAIQPRNEPINLQLVDVKPSLAPILSMKVADTAKEGGVNQIYALCGRAEKSTMRTL